MPANEDLQDAAIRHQVFLGRLESGVARRMLAFIARADARIVERIMSLPDTLTAARLERRLERLREINAALRRQFKDGLRGELGGIATFEAEHVQRVFTSVGVTFDAVSPASIRAAAISRPFQGVHLKWATTGEHVDELFRRRMKAVESEIKIAFVEGASIPDMVRRIRGTSALNFKDGLLSIQRRTAETIVRTAVNHVANSARTEFYRENADIVEGVRWLSILDSRTCIICAGRDGKVFDHGKGPRPPAHANCRCTVSPVLDEAEFGAMPETPEWNDWLKTQPREFVEDVLGKTRADLYLKGRLSLDKFTDHRGEVWTLDELRRREQSAFERAGLAA